MIRWLIIVLPFICFIANGFCEEIHLDDNSKTKGEGTHAEVLVGGESAPNYNQGFDLHKQIRNAKKRILKKPKFILIGRLGKGKTTQYAVNGEDFVIDSKTRIHGKLREGIGVRVEGFRIGKRNYASSIVVQQEVLKERVEKLPHDFREKKLIKGSVSADRIKIFRADQVR